MANPREARVVHDSKTADLVRKMIAQQHIRNQDEIAELTGFARSNVLTMIKQGRTKMPLDKIEAFSKACGCGPEKLMRTALKEYQPAVAKLISEIYKFPLFEGADEIIQVFNDAMMEALIEAKKEHRDAAENPGQAAQALRLSAELDMDASKVNELKRFVKTKMVKIVAGEKEVSKFTS